VTTFATSYPTTHAEASQTMVGKRWRPPGDWKAATRRGAVSCHGRVATGLQLTDANWMRSSALAMAAAGWALISPLLASTTNWGNDAAIARVGDAIAYLRSHLGIDSGPVALVATSMGALAALNYARQNPGAVSRIALLLPVVDLAYEHDNNVAGLAAEIEAAYGGAAGYAAAVASHDPMQNAAAHAGKSIKVWLASDDTTAVTARQRAFVDATGAASYDLGTVGHSGASINGAAVAAFVGGGS
jgi:pimeloyl-ACP methyl ester carboxylesterase